MSDRFAVTRIARPSARLVGHDWAWARENTEAIARNWRRRHAERPSMFDGRVLLACGCRVDGTACAIDLFEVAFSQFLGFRDGDSPDPGVANAFAAIVPIASDGAVLLGVMGGHTANAGQVYFPCGTPDLADLREAGQVDLAGSAEREFFEETGLSLPADAPEEWWLLAGEGQLAALRPVRFAEDAATLLARMERHRRAETDPELAGFVTAHGAADIDPVRMPGFVRAYLGGVHGR